MTSPATELARAVLRALIENAVTEVVVCPGSRNAPLSFAALDAARAGRVRLHTRVDERSAAFLALGLTKQGRRAAVVCTSGTAVANLHPAMLEAAHVGIPLVAVTADRPARLRGTDANQTTLQPGIFGELVDSIDVASPGELDATKVAWSWPLHLNLQLDDPLVPVQSWEPVDAEPGPAPAMAVPLSVSMLTHGPRTVVVAGDDAGPEARRLAQTGGWPLLAEPSSGSRTGPALRCYRLLLASELGEQVERAIVLGHPTLSRPVSRLLARDDVEVLERPGRGVWPDRPFAARSLGAGSLGVNDEPGPSPSDAAWLTAWQEADRSVARRLDALLAAEADLTPYEVVGTVSRALPEGGLLVVGPSSPIRDLDLMAPAYPVGKRRKVVANRGLAGIDGVVSTAIGMALARESSHAIALVGDVTFVHDANALVIGPGQPVPDLTVVVVNDDGGSIFTMLEQGAPEHADAFEALFGTPHGVDLASLCAATRTPYLRVDSVPELEQALASPNGGIEVVEVRVRRDTRRALDERIRALRP